MPTADEPAGADGQRPVGGWLPPAQQQPADRAAAADSVPALVERLLQSESLGPAARARLLARLAALLGSSARLAGAGAVTGGRWLSEVVLETAAAIPVRDAAALRASYPGHTEDELAQALIGAASRATAAVGAAGGALAAAEYAAPPSMLAMPIQLAAETVAVVSIELKLVAELHEVYSAAVTGSPAERASAYAMSWARRRGVDPFRTGAMPTILGTAARRELRQQILRRLGRNLSTLAPFLAGAVAGAELNRRTTRRLGELLISDLQAQRRGWFRP